MVAGCVRTTRRVVTAVQAELARQVREAPDGGSTIGEDELIGEADGQRQ